MPDNPKNILFYFDNFCGERSKGGTEVATYRIASALRKHYGHKVYNAYRKGEPHESGEVYDSVVKLSKNPAAFSKELAQFISDREIDVVVNMGRFFRHKSLVKAIEKSGRTVKTVFMHHFAPGSEMKKGTYKSGWHLLRLNPANPLYWLRATLYPLLKLPRKLSLGKAYGKVHESSDAIVVLSPGYIPEYQRLAKIGKDDDKFYVIPNIFETRDFDLDLSRKKKRVLILSRMDEIQKRITLALDIWKIIEDSGEFPDWHLDIVGTGHDMGAIRRHAAKLGLRQLTFHGWQDSRPFLERSSILLTTSDYEGLSLSMIEAQTYGCVPIAFDSYASLRDIVEDGRTGIVVDKAGGCADYAARLAALMKDDAGRETMALNCRSAASGFSSETIAEKWNQMLTQNR